MGLATAKERLLLGVSMTVLFGTPGVGLAQSAESGTQLPARSAGSSQIEEVVVTAQKRPENIQKVPMSVSAFSGDYLEKRGVVSVTEISRFLPSVAITQSNNNRNSTVLIRGIGTSGTNPGIEQSVGVFLDGVYLAAAGPIQTNLQDISTVEVLRGPQGTLYGRNTPVGAVNITTREPQQKREGMITAALGDYGDKRLGGFLGGGITPDLAGRVSFWLSDRDGYEHNLFTNDDVNGQSQMGLRGRLKWRPSEDFRANAIVYYAHINSQCCTPDQIDPTSPTGIATPGFLAASAASGRPFRNFTSGDHVVDDDYEGKDVTDSYGASIQLDKDIWAGQTLTSITAYNAYDDNIKQLPADSLPLDVSRGAQEFITETYSQELRVASPSDRRVSYIAGAYLFYETLRYDTFSTAGTQANRTFPGNLRVVPGESNHFYYRQHTHSAAAFGQVTFNITNAWRITGGLRYSYDEKTAYVSSTDSPGVSSAFRSVFPVNVPGNVDRNETKPTWSIGSQYDFTRGIMGYVLAATGYKTGGFNARAAAPGTPLEFDAETSMTYEAGLKSTLLDRKLILNVDVYRMELSDFQDSQLNPLTGTGFIVGNAGTRRVDGVEMDFQWRPLRELSFNGSASYMNGQYTDYTAGQCYAGKVANGTKPNTCNYNGLTPAQNPEWRYGIAGSWTHDLAYRELQIGVDADVSYTSSQYLDGTLDPRGYQNSYTLVGARVGVGPQNGQWRLSAYAKNLTDASYYVVASPQPLSAFTSGGGTAAAQGFVGWYGPPRTYGVQLQVRF